MSSIDDVHDDLYDDDELCYLTNTINKRYRGDDLNNVLYYYKPTVSVESCMVCADMASDFCSIDASTGPLMVKSLQNSYGEGELAGTYSTIYSNLKPDSNNKLSICYCSQLWECVASNPNHEFELIATNWDVCDYTYNFNLGWIFFAVFMSCIIGCLYVRFKNLLFCGMKKSNPEGQIYIVA